MTSFYHAGPNAYNIGDLIKPTFGKIYKQYTPLIDTRGAGAINDLDATISLIDRNVGAWLMLSRELIFENVRLKMFPHKPSRFDSVYACRSLRDLDHYLSLNPKRYERKYEVKIVDSNQPFHDGDHTAVQWERGMTYADMERRAEDWWAGKFEKNEFLTTSPLRIIRIIGQVQ